MRRPKEASRGDDGEEVTSLSTEVAAGTARRWKRREEERAVRGRAARGGAHEVQWRGGGEAVSDVF
jgi:hypothetical protein